MRSLLIAPILLITFCVMAYAQQSWTALSGDTYSLHGSNVFLSGVSCPSPDTPEGLDAKRLANTFLHAGNVDCSGLGMTKGAWAGDCRLKGNNGKTLSQVLLDSGLCKKRIDIFPDSCGFIRKMIGLC